VLEGSLAGAASAIKGDESLAEPVAFVPDAGARGGGDDVRIVALEGCPSGAGVFGAARHQMPSRVDRAKPSRSNFASRRLTVSVVAFTMHARSRRRSGIAMKRP
jgi:hypothetical protein